MTVAVYNAAAQKGMLLHDHGRAGRSSFDPPLTGKNGTQARDNAGTMAGNMHQQERQLVMAFMDQSTAVSSPLHLIPFPKQCQREPGTLRFAALPPRIQAPSDDPALHEALAQVISLISAGPAVGPGAKPNTIPLIRLTLVPSFPHPQGYQLHISAAAVAIEAKTHVGLFYALQTLIQIARQYGRTWPCLHIFDTPDYDRRGFYHDVSRGKVPTLETLIWLVKQLAAIKINEFQLYIENVFQFSGHPDFYADTTPLTPAEIREIDELCRRYHIDFVPSLTSLGHFDKILRLPRYRHLAEIEPAELQSRGIKTWSDDPWTLCVTDAASKALISELYAEFLPNFSSPTFNICCDESWDLGLGRSADAAKAKGIGRLYVDWVHFCAELAGRHGKRVQFWGDIILNHPELIDQLPKDATLLEWGYAGDHPFDEHGKLFSESGRPFYVCPGTSTWQSLGGRWDNATANLRNAAHAGLKHGAAGLLNADWGDYGHQQALAVSLLPMAYGAAVAWNVQQDSPDQHAVSAGLHLLADRTGLLSAAVCEMGNVYQSITQTPLPNASLDFKLMREPWHETEFLNQAKAHVLEEQYRRVNTIGRHFELSGDTLDADQQLARQELALTRDQILYTLTRTMARLDFFANRASHQPEPERQIHFLQLLKDRYRQLWLQRNKRSRLEDILAIFDQRIEEHRRFTDAAKA